MSDEGKETVAKLADDEGFESVFSLRKPKDAKAGFSSGVKNIAKGVVGGAVGLVAAPAVGAMDEGWKGFGKGLAAGVAGAVILPAAGVVTGAAQIAKGVANQPEAIRQQKQGRVWDPQLREWIDKPTNALATDDQIFKDSRDRWDADRRQGTFSSTTDYYEMLEVPKDATPDQIKKQYYLLARKYHPDKNPDNAEAKLRFQQLAEAYQVLADPEMRSQYDAHGKAGVDTGELKEAAEFFTLLFGSDRLEPLVGELLIAFSARSGNNVQRAEIEKFQEARQAQLAENLLRLLHPYEEMLEEEFREMIKVKAQYWVQVEGSYGYRMLRVIAKLYRLQANIHGGNLLESVGSRLQQGGSNFKSHLHAANTLVKALAHNEQMERQARKAAAASNADSAAPADDGGAAAREGATSTSAKAPTIDPMLAHEMQEKGRVLLLEVMWAGNVLDIENTVKGVCQRVLRDPSASKARLKRRAAGLQILGDILLEAAKQQEGLLEAEGKKSTKAAIAQDDMEQVARRMLEKRLAEDDAKYSTAAPASPPAAGP